MKRNKFFFPELFCIITIFFFSTIEVVGKLIGNSISPFAITGWRFFLGGLSLLPFSLHEIKINNNKLKLAYFLRFAMAGILNVCISMLFLQLSIYYGRANLSAVLISSNPLFVMILAGTFVKEKVVKNQILAILIGISGLLFFILGIGKVLWQSRDLILGVVFGLCAALTFAVSTLYSKKLIIEHGNLITICFSFILGSLFLFLFSFLLKKKLLFSLSWSNVGFIIYLSLGVTGIAYLLYFNAMKVLGATHASSYFFLKPLIASLIAWFIHKETLNLWQVIGIICVLVSLNQRLLTFFAQKLCPTTPSL